MTSKQLFGALTAICGIVVTLVSVIYGFNTSIDAKQDVRIEKLEDSRAASDGDFKLVQYKLDEVQKAQVKQAQQTEVLDNKLDEVVNRLRKDAGLHP